jgi:SAM-dependent methyltransferase
MLITRTTPVTPADLICPICPLCRGRAHTLVLATFRLDGPLLRCHSCRLHFVAPLESADTTATVAEEMERLATRAAQLELVEKKVEEAERPWRETMARERLDDLRRFIDRGTLLEVGCSTGEFLLVAREQFETCCGVEADTRAVRTAQTRGLDCHAGALAEAALPDGSFDVAVLYHVIEHFRDPRRELRELNRLLRTGGHLVVETPDIETIWFRILGARWRQIIPDHLFFFSRSTLNRLLSEEGFTVTEVRHVGKSMSLRLFLSRIGRYSRILAQLGSLFIRLAHLEEVTLRLNLRDVIRVYAVKSATPDRLD